MGFSAEHLRDLVFDLWREALYGADVTEHAQRYIDLFTLLCLCVQNRGMNQNVSVHCTEGLSPSVRP